MIGTPLVLVSPSIERKGAEFGDLSLSLSEAYQLLNLALGGTLVIDLARQVPGALEHRRLKQRDRIVHDVHLTADSLLAKITGTRTLGVNSTHHQVVDRAAAPLRVIGRSADGVAEAMQLSRETAHLLPFLLSVQFHPERLVDRYPARRAIFKAFTRACAANRRDKL